MDVNDNAGKSAVQSNLDRFAEDLLQFIEVIDAIYGVYLDASAGFHLFRQQLLTCQTQAQRVTGLSGSELDTREFLFGVGPPKEEWSVVLHRATQGEVKERNQKNGKNQRFFGNMCLIAIYQFWEDTYRGRLAKALGMELKELSSDVFGDIRLLRIDILHKRGIATADPSKFKILRWFTPGETINLSNEQLEEMIARIKEDLFALRNQYLP